MDEKPKAARDKPKIAKEVAESDFDRFVAEMDLDLSTDGMDAEDRTQLEQSKRRIVNAIFAGSLVVDATGIPTFTPRRSEDREPIVFAQPKGADFMQADLIRKNRDIEKSYAIMAASTRQPLSRYATMVWSDLRVCQAIINLYMGG